MVTTHLLGSPASGWRRLKKWETVWTVDFATEIWQIQRMHVNTMIFQMFPGKKHFQFWDGKRINTMVSKIFIMKSSKNRWPSHYPRVRFEVHPSPAQHEAGRWCSIVTSGSRDLALPAMGQMGVSENGFLSHPNGHFNQKRMIKRMIFSLSKFGAADFQINSNMPLQKTPV